MKRGYFLVLGLLVFYLVSMISIVGVFASNDTTPSKVKVFKGRILGNGNPFEGAKVEITTIHDSTHEVYETYTNKGGIYNIRVNWYEDMTIQIIVIYSTPLCIEITSDWLFDVDPKPLKKDYNFQC